MHVASKELCQELYAVSGWEETSFTYYEFSDGITYAPADLKPEEFVSWLCRAYDLGYMLRKLRKNSIGYAFGVNKYLGELQYTAYFGNDKSFADTPEDAAAKLCIELIKQGIITPNQRERK